MTVSVPQEVLVQPTRTNDETTAEWRARYSSAFEALIAALMALPGVSDPGAHEWAGNPNIIVIRTSAETFAPGFQFDADGKPIELVETVNFRLALRYRDGAGAPWGSSRIGPLVWWLQVHPEIRVAPVDLLGTERESELVDLATNPRSLR